MPIIKQIDFTALIPTEESYNLLKTIVSNVSHYHPEKAVLLLSLLSKEKIPEFSTDKTIEMLGHFTSSEILVHFAEQQSHSVEPDWEWEIHKLKEEIANRDQKIREFEARVDNLLFKRAVFIYNLVPTVDKKVLLDLFSDYSIQEIQIASTGKYKKACVILNDQSEIEKFVRKFNFYIIDGVEIFVIPENQQLFDSGKNTVKVLNLPAELGSDQLYEAFSNFGKLVAAKVVPSEDGISTVGYVQYCDVCDVYRAMEDLRDSEINGRRLRLKKWDRPFIEH